MKTFKEFLVETEEQKVTTRNGKIVPKDRKELKKLVRDASIHLGDIDTSLVDDMSWLFYHTYREDFSGIENWDVSNVTDMSNMFYDCRNFNQPIGRWDVSKVRWIDHMFFGCTHFNQPLDKWNVSKVEKVNGMFLDADNFRQDLSRWSKVNPDLDLDRLTEDDD